MPLIASIVRMNQGEDRSVASGMTQATQSIPLPRSHPSRHSSWRHSSSALAVPNFRLFAAANVLGMTATWAQRVAQDWLVLQLTGSVAAVGLTVAMQFGP